MSDDHISKILNITPLDEAIQDDITEGKIQASMALQEREEAQTPAVIVEEDENVADIELARNNVKNIIEMGDDAVKEMVEIAKQSESPRAFEVVSTLMKTLLDANKDFVDLSTQKKHAREVEPAKETNVTNNNLIVSTADLLKMLKGEDDNA